MKKNRNRSEISTEALKKQIFQGVSLFIVLAALVTGLIFLFRSRIYEAGIKRSLLTEWESGSWEAAYKKSREGLAVKPLDTFVLTINGFAAYQMALAQVNTEQTLAYIEESIQSLRKALLNKNADRDGRIRYVLGKAYYAKGPDYADLAVKYLEAAKTASFTAGDFDEYLGLSYAAVRDYRKSVEAFSASLEPGREDSDLLLLHIAQSYMGLEDWETAKAYLVRCAELSKDTDLTIKARLLLGKTLVHMGNTGDAVAAFESVLETSGENAEASYELGEIYAALGDTTRARAAWRRAFRADPNFTPVVARLNTM